jgi:hypothetical protein
MQSFKTILCLVAALTLNSACNPPCSRDNKFDVTVNVTTSLRDSVAIINTPLKSMAFTITSTPCINSVNVALQPTTDSLGLSTTVVKGLNENFCEGTSCQPDLKVVPVASTQFILFSTREEITKTVKSYFYVFKKR